VSLLIYLKVKFIQKLIILIFAVSNS